MTSSEERTSAEFEGYRIERSRNLSVSSSRLLVAKGDLRPADSHNNAGGVDGAAVVVVDDRRGSDWRGGLC